MQKVKQTIKFPLILTNTYLVLMSSVFILWPGAGGYAAIQQGKYHAFLILTCSYLGLMALFSLQMILTGQLAIPKPMNIARSFSSTQWMILLYLLFTTISTLLSPHRNQALIGMTRNEGLLTHFLYCSTFLCVSSFVRIKRWMGWILSSTMVCFCGICLLQMQGLNPLNLYPDGLTYFDANINYSGIYLGTIGNADLVAALLCLTLPIVTVLAFQRKDRFGYLYLLPAVLCVVVLIEMNVQAGIIGVGLGLLLSFPKMLPLSQKQRRIAYATVVLLLLCALTMVFLSDVQSGSIYELREVLHGNWKDEFGNGRVLIWRQLLERIPENLLFGTGPDTMSAYEIPGYFWYHAETDTTIPLMVDVAHNEYLNILFHQGIFALLSYIGALAVTAIRWLRTDDPKGIVLGCGVLCYCIQAFFGFSMCPTASLFWLMWALLERLLNEETEEKRT